MERGLFGRDDELAAVDAFLDRAQTRFAALVFEGEPGIGKTTLWRDALRRAKRRGFLVLSSAPAEAEAKLSYLGLTDLIGPLPEEILAVLPPVQRDALEVALLRAPSGGGSAEPLAVAAALRAVLADAARDRPVLVAVDDAQWLDAASAAALAYALRRLPDEPIGAVATMRPAAPGSRRRLCRTQRCCGSAGSASRRCTVS